MIFAAVASIFSACDQREIVAPVQFDGSFEFTSPKPVINDDFDTKTGWTGSSVQWLKGDNIRMAFKVDNEWQGKEGDENIRIYASKALTEDTDKATFIVPTDFNKDYTSSSDSKFEFFGLYPTKAVSSTSIANPPTVTISIPTEQTPKEDSFDASADILVGKAEATGMPSEAILMSWNRVVALGQITLKNLNVTDDEAFETVTFTAQEGADLVGSHSLDLVEGTVSNPKGTNNVITVNASGLKLAADNSLKVWVGLLPETITSLTVTVETNKAVYTREITGISKTFIKNKRNILGIKMDTATRVEKEVAPVAYPYSATLAEMGDFSIENIAIPEELTYVWTIDTNNKYAKASAYKGSAFASEALLVSPYIDMSGSVNPILTFKHTSKYFTDIQSETAVLVRVQGSDTWSTLEIDAYPTNNDWTFVDATASLEAYKSNVIQIAFKYTSTDAAAGTWEIKNFKVDEAPEIVEGIGFKWDANGITDGYTLIVENGYFKNNLYYQDKDASTGLDLLFKKSDNSAIITSTPKTITLKVTVGGGTTRDPLNNSVYAYFVDSDGKNIGLTQTVVTSKVETTTGNEYTITLPLVDMAYGIRLSHAKESSYNVRVYKVELSVE